MVDELLIYLGENDPELGDSCVFSVVSSDSGDSEVTRFVLNARDVPVKLSWIEWLRNGCGFFSDKNHPCFRDRVKLIPKKNIFTKTGGVIKHLVLPKKHADLWRSILSDSDLATCLETYYAVKSNDLSGRIIDGLDNNVEAGREVRARMGYEKDLESQTKVIEVHKKINEASSPARPLNITPQNQNSGQLPFMDGTR